MRHLKVLYLITTCLIVCFPAFAQKNKQSSVVKFNKTAHDFGTLAKKNALQECTFEIENTGKKPLVILNVKTNCGCAVASYTFAPIKPGSKGKIKIKYDGKNKAPGTFIKSVSVYTNATPKPFLLYIKGNLK